MAFFRKCWTIEQNALYNKLAPKRQAYVDFRCQGFGKAESYRRAGYKAKDPGREGRRIEEDNPEVKRLIEDGTNLARVAALSQAEPDVKINEDLREKAKDDTFTKSVKAIVKKAEDADAETAKRIIFYQDIINGKIKTVKKTTILDKDGEVKSTKIEETSNIETRMLARKELDNLLGLRGIATIDQFKVKNITINIVDASKKEEVEDSRNKIELDPDSVEVLNGEEVIVTDSNVETENSQKETDENDTDE